MMAVQNVFRIEGKEIIPLGISVYPPITERGRPTYARVVDSTEGPRTYERLLAMPLPPYREPRLEGRLMVEAAPLFRPGKQPTLIERGNWDGVIVEIDPGKLEFSTTPILAEGLNLWPGGEWEPNVPVIRFGPRSNINKIEVWALTAGSSLYVIDGRSRVVHLSAAMGCGAHLHVVTYQRLAEYIARRCAEATEVRAVEWAYRNLNALARRYPSLQREAELAENKYHRLRKFT